MINWFRISFNFSKRAPQATFYQMFLNSVPLNRKSLAQTAERVAPGQAEIVIRK